MDAFSATLLVAMILAKTTRQRMLGTYFVPSEGYRTCILMP